jgi:hypothetical protein
MQTAGGWFRVRYRVGRKETVQEKEVACELHIQLLKIINKYLLRQRHAIVSSQ